MKISSITLTSEKRGIKPFSTSVLGDIVILTGANGAGKTRILKLIQDYVGNLHKGILDKDIEITIEMDTDVALTTDNADKIQIINYSHYDARLQSPTEFTPYVIHKAKDILQSCDYEETALNSLLFLWDMAYGYSEEFKDKHAFRCFQRRLREKFNIRLSHDKGTLKINDREIEQAFLSPGQQYLLRMAVACHQNQNKDELVFFLDEPELHLHPKALIDIIRHMKQTFPKSQFWISTHSLSLIAGLSSHDENTTVLTVKDGGVSLFRSDSSDLLAGLLGSEDNRKAIQAFVDTPDKYACNKFSIECNQPPETLPAAHNDAQVYMTKQILKRGDIVVDYGAGKGRFFEGLGIDYASEDIARHIHYYAFDEFKDDAERCKYVMDKYGSTSENYFNDISKLNAVVKGKADYVLLVNVLHEIVPNDWIKVFDRINKLLKENGKLIIVERDELTIGEAPYDDGFLVLTPKSADCLFGKENTILERHHSKSYIVRYTISKSGLNVNNRKISSAIAQIKSDSLDKIKELRSKSKNETNYKKGLKTAFWLHQYANSSLILNSEDN